MRYMRSTQHGPQAINYLESAIPIFCLLAQICTLPGLRMLLLIRRGARHRSHLSACWRSASPANALLALALAASISCIPLHGANTFDFHQIVLATLLLLFVSTSLSQGATARSSRLCSAMLVKETRSHSSAIGVYVFIGRRRRNWARRW
jgi:uncharacterized membrane protein